MTHEEIRAAVAEGMSAAKVGELVGMERRAVMRLVLKHNLGPWKSHQSSVALKFRPTPDDFAIHAKTMSIAQLAAHYDASWKTAGRWFKESGVNKADVKRRKQPIPAGFAEAALTMSSRELGAKFGFSDNTALRIRRELGIEPPKFKPVPPTGRRPVATAANRALGHSIARLVAPSLGHGEEAARYLQSNRGGGWTVFRCTETGAQLVRGKFWRVGRAICTDAELMERAVRKGFNPNAWRQLVAA